MIIANSSVVEMQWKVRRKGVKMLEKGRKLSKRERNSSRNEIDTNKIK